MPVRRYTTSKTKKAAKPAARRFVPARKPVTSRPPTTYARNDLTDPEAVQVQRLTLAIVDNTARIAGGYLGKNLIVVSLPTGYSAAVGDVVSLTPLGSGFIVTEKIGTNTLEVTSTGLPFDVNQIDPGQAIPYVLGLDSYPPAIVRTEFPDGSIRTVSDRIRYGKVGSRTVRTALFYGRSVVAEPEYKRTQRLWYRSRTPAPAQFTIGLLAQPYPPTDGSMPTPTETGTVTPSYNGPDVTRYVALPTGWQDQLAAGTAGGLSIAPATAAVGVVELELGPGGSGSLTDDFLDLSGA